ncbi:MAG: hypothetical protein HQM12_09845 [SAR324 cluster bacterium]|nr:hypothetical protein [SAR324 cluster bacterium]
MHVTYQLNADEIDQNWLAGLKQTFEGKEIEIMVRDVDETQYLLTGETNRKHLLQAIKNIEERKNLIEVDLSDPEIGS